MGKLKKFLVNFECKQFFLIQPVNNRAGVSVRERNFLLSDVARVIPVGLGADGFIDWSLERSRHGQGWFIPGSGGRDTPPPAPEHCARPSNPAVVNVYYDRCTGAFHATGFHGHGCVTPGRGASRKPRYLTPVQRYENS